MSAYIVEKRHILYLVCAATARRLDRHHGSFCWYHEDKHHELRVADYERAAEVAQMLWRENILSVGHRYPHESSATLPGPIGEDFAITAQDVMSAHFHTFEPPQVLMSIHCYEYQSCEHPGWKTSEAKAFCDALQGRACRSVTGYEDAKWGAPEEPQRTRKSA